MKNYLKNSLFADIGAGLVVFLVALPLCLGIALASGAPLFSGIISGIVGGIVVSSFSGSTFSISGPANSLMVIVAAAFATLHSLPMFLMALFLAGCLQIVLGLIKAGDVAQFFPSSIIRGMLAAIGIILIMKQIPHALGYDSDFEGDFSFIQSDNRNSFTEILNAISKVNIDAFIITIISIILLVFLGRPNIQKRIYVPVQLLVVLFGIGMNALFARSHDMLVLKDHQLVELPFINLSYGVEGYLTTPFFRGIFRYDVWKVAFTIAIIASLETLLNIDALDKLDPEKRESPKSKELIAQGLGNMVAGLIGGIPIASVVVRGSVNLNAGAKTRMAAIFHALFMLGSVLFLTEFINQIPLACLSAILLVSGYKLASKELFVSIYKLGRDQFIPFVVTIICILFTDLLVGIMMGLLFGLAFILYRSLFKTPSFEKLQLDYTQPVIITLPEEVSFLNKIPIVNTLKMIAPGSRVVIDGSKSYFIDINVIEAILAYQLNAKRQKIRVELIDISLDSNSDRNPSIQVTQKNYDHLFINNKLWVEDKLLKDKGFFERLNKEQRPTYLYIGCADSRLLPNEFTGTDPGEILVHRNIANIADPDDLNFNSVLDFSINYLNISNIIICGHYGCSSIKETLAGGIASHTPLRKWLKAVSNVRNLNTTQLRLITSNEEKVNMLVELNVLFQAKALENNPIITEARATGKKIKIHPWVLDTVTGMINDLELRMEHYKTEENKTSES